MIPNKILGYLFLPLHPPAPPKSNEDPGQLAVNPKHQALGSDAD